MNDYLPSKRPLNDLEIEKAVLGALLLENNAIEKIIDLDPKAEWFDKSSHKVIFSAILELFEKQKAIDMLTVNSLITEKGLTESIGGAFAVASLTMDVNTSTNLREHIAIVHDFYKRREIGSNAYALYSAMHNTNDKEADYYLADFEEKTSKLSLTSNEKETEQIALQQNEVLREIEEAKKLKESKGLVGLPSGIKEFDELTGGFRKQELTFIGARPSHGKTNIFNQIASLSSRYDDGIFVIFSLEMSKNKLGLRMNAFEAGEPYQDFLKGAYTEEQKLKLLQYPVSENIFINDKTDVTSKDIRKVVYSLSKKYKILGVSIDYIQMFKDVSNKISRHLFLEMESYALKAIAKEFDIPVIALVQTNREAEEKKETSVRHLKESAGMEQAADVIIFLECVKKWGIDFIEVEDEYGLKQELDTYDPTTNYLLHNFNVVKNRNGAVKNIIVEGDIARGRYWSYNHSLYLKNWINKRYE